MADKLTYKGGKSVVGSVGTMKLVLPKGGGDFHSIPRWWKTKGTVSYVEAAIFKVPLDNGESVRLVLPDVKAHMTVDIRHDGNGTFTFPNDGGLERVAVVGANSLSIIHEYQFAKISGGSILKRTLASLPEPVSEEITFDQLVAAADILYNVGVNNIGTAETPQNVFTLNGVDAPDLTLSVNDTVVFDYSGVAANHPLALYTDQLKSALYTTGVQEQNNQILWTVTEPGTFSYQCQLHNQMGGLITVS